MTAPYFFHAPLPGTGDLVELSADEARHAAASRRLEVGDALALLDGRGGLAHAVVERVGKSGRVVHVRVGPVEHRPRPRPVTLACALPKGDRLSTLLDMATQLGLTDFVPLACRRSVHTAAEHAPQRWERIVLEASKQSRRAWLPAFHPPASPVDVARRAVADGAAVLLAHPADALPDGLAASAAPIATDRPVTLLVGPEGGFTDDEVRGVLAAGAAAVDLGPNILRIETAAVALLARLIGAPAVTRSPAPR